MPGAEIADGSVIGANSMVTSDIPNNVVAVGAPARVVRTDIAWERPHLGLVAPYYKPDGSAIEKSAYWHLTQWPDGPDTRGGQSLGERLRGSAERVSRYLRSRGR